MFNIINRTKYRDLEKYYDDLRSYYQRTLEVLEVNDEYDLSLIICGPVTIRRINREYRNIDSETDVISFALLDDSQDSDYDETVELGDIFINRNRVYQQAGEYGHSVKREFVFLFVHGLLHLFGYDHMEKEDERRMFSLQDEIIGKLK